MMARMIVLDTNVISELMRSDPSMAVRKWFRAQRRRDLFTTAITQGEIRLGIAMLPPGRRRDGIAGAAARMFGELFSGRVLPFDSRAAIAYAELAAACRAVGRPINWADNQIAGICLSRETVMATRNVHDFIDCGLILVNP